MSIMSYTHCLLFFCSDGISTPVRLEGGTTHFEGVVQISYNGTWGTICDDSFDDNDAKVICRMLQFPW